ncbi:hypothetical protein HYC85_016212 [Camellia sinensis]|uniref:EGF-like domain-containing protein n=1 Tax=Camellia sinensis TaxID=4442 RepID=A0A7J7H2D9_CAMSI|nr:hypothetical protein HYC85_016212 [Camellia sinensis]
MSHAGASTITKCTRGRLRLCTNGGAWVVRQRGQLGLCARRSGLDGAPKGATWVVRQRRQHGQHELCARGGGLGGIVLQRTFVALLGNLGKGALKDCNWTAIFQDQRSNHMGVGSFQYALLIVTQQEQCVSVAKVLNTQTVVLLRHVGLNLPSEPEGPKLIDWTKPRLDNIFTTNSSILGWCNVNPREAYPSKVRFKEECDCKYDCLGKQLCEVTVLCTCVNQCSGHGHCRGGFCQVCDNGWYGIDCSIPSVDVPDSPQHIGNLVNLNVVVEKKRPLIYVYDLPSEFNNLLHEVAKGVVMPIYGLEFSGALILSCAYMWSF